jgi:hypothetical protein
MIPTEAESAMRSHLEAEYVDRLQRENATLRETLENERKFLAASREVYSEAMSRLAALEAENKALRDRFAEADTERNGAQMALRRAYDAASRAADMRAAGNALARHVAEDTRGQTARRIVQAWEEAAR